MSKAKPEIISELRKIPEGLKLLLAVSGGVDSIVLLHGMSRLQLSKHWKIEVVHVDHGLRKESRKDAEFVNKVCAGLKLKLHTKRARTSPKKGDSVEAWARGLRYREFDKLAKARKFDFVILAHNANDLAESLFVRLLTNKEISAMRQIDSRRHLLRPLLNIDREQILSYAKQQRLTWVEDASNRDPRFVRNRVRLKLMPLLLKEFECGGVQGLAYRAQSLSDDHLYLEELAGQLAAKIASGARPFSKDWVRRSRAMLGKFPHAMGWRIVEQALLAKLGFRVGRNWGQKILNFITSNSANIEIPGGFLLKRKAGAIQIGKNSFIGHNY